MIAPSIPTGQEVVRTLGGLTATANLGQRVWGPQHLLSRTTIHSARAPTFPYQLGSPLAGASSLPQAAGQSQRLAEETPKITPAQVLALWRQVCF